MKLRDQLSNKKEELKKINEELDHFVYATSHELRSPLTTILGILNLMEKDTKGISLAKHIQLMRSGISRVDEFIKEVLDYSRNNRGAIAIEAVSISDIVDNVINSFEKRSKNILFLRSIQEEYSFYSDPERIKMIIEYLIDNAIKYSKCSKALPYINIHILVEIDRAVITFEDIGIGFTSEHQKNIFGMFYRVSSEKPGTGMGLYLVKELVGKLKGNIIVESELNKGTKFMITLLNLRNERTL